MPERMRRINESVRRVLSEAVGQLKDPRIGFVTVTGVKVTADLGRAWVFYTALGDDKERAATRAGLRSATPYLRASIGKQVRLKFLPELEFEEDVSLEHAARIDRLIEELHAEDAGA